MGSVTYAANIPVDPEARYRLRDRKFGLLFAYEYLREDGEVGVLVGSYANSLGWPTAADAAAHRDALMEPDRWQVIRLDATDRNPAQVPVED
jgi:hypothetical protein